MRALTAGISGWSTTATLFAVCILCCSPPGHAGEQAGAEVKPETERHVSFYKNRKQGFYWYQDDPVKKEDERKTANELWTMPPERFRALMQATLDAAVQYPTKENVYDYMLMLDISKKKAQAFSSVMAWVGKNHPELSNQVVFPVTAPGRRAWFADAAKDMEQTLERARDRFAMIIFSSDACSYCEAQDKILEFFIQRYGWTVKKIDFDTRQDLAWQFGVTLVPAIILLHRDTEKALPVSSGVVSMEELKESIYQAVLTAEGKVTPENYGRNQKSRQAADVNNPLDKP